MSSLNIEDSNSSKFGGTDLINALNSKIESSKFKNSISTRYGGSLYFIKSSSVNEIFLVI